MTALVAACLLAVPDGTLVDQVVAVVDKEVITRTELVVEARVALVLRRGGKVAASASLDEEYLASFREYLVNQHLISAQARRLGAVDVKDEEVERELERFASGFASASASEAFLRRHEISIETVRAIVRRELRNARYVDQRMRARLLGAPRDVKSTDAEYRAALERWLIELRETAEIRLPGPDGELEVQDDKRSKGDERRSADARSD